MNENGLNATIDEGKRLVYLIDNALIKAEEELIPKSEINDWKHFQQVYKDKMTNLLRSLTPENDHPHSLLGNSISNTVNDLENLYYDIEDTIKSLPPAPVVELPAGTESPLMTEIMNGDRLYSFDGGETHQQFYTIEDLNNMKERNPNFRNPLTRAPIMKKMKWTAKIVPSGTGRKAKKHSKAVIKKATAYLHSLRGGVDEEQSPPRNQRIRRRENTPPQLERPNTRQRLNTPPTTPTRELIRVPVVRQPQSDIARRSPPRAPERPVLEQQPNETALEFLRRRLQDEFGELTPSTIRGTPSSIRSNISTPLSIYSTPIRRSPRR